MVVETNEAWPKCSTIKRYSLDAKHKTHHYEEPVETSHWKEYIVKPQTYDQKSAIPKKERAMVKKYKNK